MNKSLTLKEAPDCFATGELSVSQAVPAEVYCYSWEELS